MFGWLEPSIGARGDVILGIPKTAREERAPDPCCGIHSEGLASLGALLMCAKIASQEQPSSRCKMSSPHVGASNSPTLAGRLTRSSFGAVQAREKFVCCWRPFLWSAAENMSEARRGSGARIVVPSSAGFDVEQSRRPPRFGIPVYVFSLFPSPVYPSELSSPVSRTSFFVFFRNVWHLQKVSEQS